MSYNPNNANGQATSANSAPVVVASDQSNLPTNTKQLNGVSVSVGNGTTDTGTQRVSLSSDSTGQVKLAASSGVDIGKLTANQSVNVAQINAVTPLMGNGVTGTGSQRVTIASDNTAFSVNATLQAGSALAGKVGIDQTTVGTTNGVSLAQIGSTTIATGNGTSSAGVQRVALVSDQTTNTNPLYTKQQAQAAGGATPFQLISAATTNATSVKGSAGTVYGVQAFNNSATVAFLKLYNKATAPTVGTDTPVKTIMIPANGGAVLPITDIGVAFGTGIALAVTGLATVSDTTAVALSQCQIGIDYA